MTVNDKIIINTANILTSFSLLSAIINLAIFFHFWKVVEMLSCFFFPFALEWECKIILAVEVYPTMTTTPSEKP